MYKFKRSIISLFVCFIIINKERGSQGSGVEDG